MSADLKKAAAEAAKLLRIYEIKKPPIDPEAIAEAQGVDVIYAKFKPEISKEVSGFIRFNHGSDDAPQIVVNKVISENSMAFTIAHELGHYLLHKAYAESKDYQVMPRSTFYPQGKPQEEQEADCFAASLLVPEVMLREYSDKWTNDAELARIFGVPRSVILSRRRFAPYGCGEGGY